MNNKDIDIKKQFQEKNWELFINKLMIDIDSNSNNLLLTTENLIILFFRKIDDFVAKSLDSNNISYSRFKIDQFNSAQRVKLYLLISNVIKEKYVLYKEYFKNNKNDFSTEKKYIKCYFKYIDEKQDMFVDNLTSVINKYKAEYLSELKKEFSVDITSLNLSSLDELLEKIISENGYRSVSLKSMITESFEFYLNLKK